jgi:hypothetical protein
MEYLWAAKQVVAPAIQIASASGKRVLVCMNSLQWEQDHSPPE